MIERYDLIPKECVFLDDRMDNCEAAAKFGMKTICFTTKEAAIEELKNIMSIDMVLSFYFSSFLDLCSRKDVLLERYRMVGLIKFSKRDGRYY